MQADPADAALSTYPFQITLPARFTDIDATGHIGHVGLARYYEEVRTAFLRHVVRDFPRAWNIFMGRVTAQHYSYPIYPHPISFGAGVASISARSYVIEIAGFQRGICFCRSRAVGVLVGENGPTLVDDELRGLLSPVLLAESHFPAAEKPGAERQRLERYAHRLELETRFSDTDGLGHLNNVSHLRYCDEGRAALLLQATGSEDPSALGTVASFDVSYLREGKFFAPLMIGTSVTAVAGEIVHLSQALFQEQGCIATCDSTLKVSETAAQRLRAMRTA